MPIQSHEKWNMQGAAFELCRRLGEDPSEVIQDPAGVLRPRWEVHAEQLATIRKQLEVLRDWSPL